MAWWRGGQIPLRPAAAERGADARQVRLRRPRQPQDPFEAGACFVLPTSPVRRSLMVEAVGLGFERRGEEDTSFSVQACNTTVASLAERCMCCLGCGMRRCMGGVGCRVRERERVTWWWSCRCCGTTCCATSSLTTSLSRAHCRASSRFPSLKSHPKPTLWCMVRCLIPLCPGDNLLTS